MEQNISQQEVKNNSLQWWKIVLLCLRQFILAIIILLGIPVFTMVGFKSLYEFNPGIAYQLVTVGPWSVYTWILLVVIVAWYRIVLAVWMTRDAMKFKKQGMRTMPFLWAIGMIFPVMFEVFSIYLIQRGINVIPFLGAIGIIPFVVFSIYFILSGVFWSRKLKNDVNVMEQGKAKKWFVPSKRIREILLSTVVIVFVAYAVAIITDLPKALDKTLNKRRTDEQVAKIHATKLTLDDVMGKNLPPDPGADADKTVQGIDANQNGIRDDVELAIFEEYPDSAKTRAVLLQYALALQMEVTQKIVNEGTVTEVVREQSRADICIADTLVPRKSPESSRSYSDIEKIDVFINFVKEKQRNTAERKKARKDFVEKIGSYSESENEVCDINLSALPN